MRFVLIRGSFSLHKNDPRNTRSQMKVLEMEDLELLFEMSRTTLPARRTSSGDL